MRDDKARTAFCGVAIYNKDLKQSDKYLNEYFYSCLNAYGLTKMWGLAHGKGWAEEPMAYIEAITAIESEFNSIENAKLAKQQEDMKIKTSKGKSKG